MRSLLTGLAARCVPSARWPLAKQLIVRRLVFVGQRITAQTAHAKSNAFKDLAQIMARGRFLPVPYLPLCRLPSSAACVPRSSISPFFVSLRSAPAPLFHRSISRCRESTAAPSIRPCAHAFDPKRDGFNRVQTAHPHKTISAPTLEDADVLPRWLAITIPARMLCDSTGNVCNAKERP